MLDACPHHHETPEETEAAEAALEGLTPRSPRTSKGPGAGKKYWRSLDELSETKAFSDMLHREFPYAASEWNDEPSRRSFLKLMSASLALGGLAACTLPKTQEKILPYVNPPEEMVPGRPLFFATSMPWCGYAKGVVVESHEGRPTNVQGNTDHPASLGSSDIWMQSSVLDLYDPDRSQTFRHGNDITTWGAFVTMLRGEMDAKRANGGAGLRILTGAITSPTQARLINDLLKDLPQAKWHQWEPIGRSNCKAGMMAAFGRDVQPVYAFENANVVVSFDSNFLSDDAGSLVYARKFIDKRRVRMSSPDSPVSMNRLYTVETSVTITGAMADHRIVLKSTEVEAFAHDVLAAVSGAAPSGPHAKMAGIIARDLQANKGSSLVLAGEAQPAAVHTIAAILNTALGNAGKTVNYIEPVEASGPRGPATLGELVADMDAGNVDMLIVSGTNPVFTAPYDYKLVPGSTGSKEEFAKNPLAKVRLSIHHGLYTDETAYLCQWHVPASHYLEAWGDLKAFDGTASIVQPLIYPLYGTKSEVELFGYLAGESDRGGMDMVRDTWNGKISSDDWQRALEKGVIPNTASKPVSVSLVGDVASKLSPSTQPTAGGLEICFRPDPTVWDGRWANNPWLQELPKSISQVTWDNVALMSVTTGRKLGISHGDEGKGIEASIVEITLNGRKIKLPAMMLAGHADDSITIYMGYGRSKAGWVGNGQGQNAYDYRSSTTMWTVPSATIAVTDVIYPIATSQTHHLMEKAISGQGMDRQLIEDRELFKSYDLDELSKRPGGKKTISLPLLNMEEQEDPAETLLPKWDYEHRDKNNGQPDPDYNKWGMVIDNNACIGCNACVVACQSENNIPVVGRDQVLKGREMHWLRIDTYFEGDAEGSPDVNFQPIPCMNCENAPCTLVCPVEATSISAEGINEQTYNRCVGTRYCSNNCPYKVRRFNFLYYNDYKTESWMLQKNPNVTVRSRGVMEKCNYCVQRVNNGRIEAKKQDRPINPGEVVTACAQSCPTKAISFGNLNDDRWEVTQLQKEELRYTLLDDLNTRPRTSYLAKVRNPNPEWA